MVHRFFAAGVSCAIILATILACSVEDGERVMTGECPEETCVETLTGLTFYTPGLGAAPATTMLYPVAVGGTATIGIEPVGGSLIEGENPTFLLAGDAISLLGSGSSDYFDPSMSTDMLGLTEGEVLLRVTNDDGTLYDRIRYSAREVTHVDAVVYGREGSSLERGEFASVVFRLLADDETRLLDADLGIESSVEFTPVSWDCVDVEVPNTDEVHFTISVGDQRWNVVLPVR